MSSWGTAIFDDDLTADLRDTYREHLIDGVSNDEATRLTLADYDELVGTDEEHLVWLAIAAAQRQVGRLQPAIRDRALQVIDDGVGLELWADPAGRIDRQRARALRTLRSQLTGPQHPPRRIRRAWADTTDLEVGDVLQYVVSDGRIVLFRVVAVTASRGRSSAILGWLDWVGLETPPPEVIAALSIRPGEPAPVFDLPPEILERLAAMPEVLQSLRDSFANLEARLALYQPFRLGRSAPGWADCGFTRIAHLDQTADLVTPEDDAAGLTGCEWEVLAAECERLTTGPIADDRPAH